jgi:hypothetical protein
VRLMTTAAVAAALIGITASGAAAQGRFQSATPEAKGFLSVNGVFQATSNTFTEQLEFTEFVETGTIESRFGAKPAVGLDGTLGIRVWRRFGVGVGMSTYSSPSGEGGDVTARIPHPFHFNQHREVSGDADLSRKETAIHASLLYFAPVGRRMLAVLGGGATYFQADQNFVNRVLYDQEYPYDTVTFRGVDRDNESASGLGFNASADLSFRFSKSFGVGAAVRYSHATLPFTPGDREVKVDVGGLQAGLGLRVIF